MEGSYTKATFLAAEQTQFTTVVATALGVATSAVKISPTRSCPATQYGGTHRRGTKSCRVHLRHRKQVQPR